MITPSIRVRFKLHPLKCGRRRICRNLSKGSAAGNAQLLLHAVHVPGHPDVGDLAAATAKKALPRRSAGGRGMPNKPGLRRLAPTSNGKTMARCESYV